MVNEAPDSVSAIHENSTPSKRPWSFGNQGGHSPPPDWPPPSHIENNESISDGSTKHTCLLGSVIDVQVQPCNTSGLSNIWNESIDPVFSVVQEGDYFCLQFCEVRFGRLNKGTCKHLQALTAHKRVSLRGFTSGRAWVIAIHSWFNNIPALLPIELSIYAEQEDAKEIGDILSTFGVFLQWPRYGREGYHYFNPHLLRLEGYSDQIPTSRPQVSKQSPVLIPEKNTDRTAQVNVAEAVDGILNSLSHHVQVQDISMIPGFKTMPLDHQKEAMDFIFRRETGQSPPERSLWKYNDADANEPFYQHIFTGSKRPEKAEIRGGIIADEMGLGKTLVMLSTIASSIDRAHEFVASENQLRLTQPLRKVPSRATLIVVPSAVLINSWVVEIEKHVYPGTLAFHKHIGTSRHNEDELVLLCQKLIVFTTYATAAYELRHKITHLSDINWFRIILDEAHDIRTRTTQQYQGVASISAQHRWCLTGTPIQNSLDDLAALVSFLKMPVLEKPETFRKFITKPISSGTNDCYQNLQRLLQSVCLRRTRELLNLPEPETYYQTLPLTASEYTEYNELLRECKRDIDMAVSGRGKGQLKSAMLESLLKVRLFCNNGRAAAVLPPGPKVLPEDPDELLAYLQQRDENFCAHCDGVVYFISNTAETDGGMFLPSCRHLVCHSCSEHMNIGKGGNSTRKGNCPLCAPEKQSTSLAVIASSDTGIPRGSFEDRSAAQPRQYPSKLLKLLSDISGDRDHKSIVFSCWKKTLDIVSRLLRSKGLRHHLIDGSLLNAERIKILDEFRTSTSLNILLMTLGTGAVGLNLAAASRVYLLEPQWNPSIESQAIGRALRLGQTDRVVIIRYIMKGTVEESNVLSRQQRKLELAGGGFGKGRDMAPETRQALRDFFDVNE
ncbi:SNF2 family N-terminal domain-containing protein [Stachybotrys elegans]|uniref:SNF2 family N-terminal domain-containing protein n=1 Tax=Stachybotrys elegans TaxID=80388 RepID=A0A8K0WM88_9HYPO|nr:SNF2 family N-terminal domain-containing protein [Stachybotrys elegans]